MSGGTLRLSHHWLDVACGTPEKALAFWGKNLVKAPGDIDTFVISPVFCDQAVCLVLRAELAEMREQPRIDMGFYPHSAVTSESISGLRYGYRLQVGHVVLGPAQFVTCPWCLERLLTEIAAAQDDPDLFGDLAVAARAAARWGSSSS